MMTRSTTPSFTATIVMFTTEETLIPMQITAVRISTMTAAIRLCSSPYIHVGIVTPADFMTSAKYVDQPTATVLAPSASSRIRSQPMIQAISSPRLAYENVYAEPATGTVLANSA